MLSQLGVNDSRVLVLRMMDFLCGVRGYRKKGVQKKGDKKKTLAPKWEA